jgi:hypothetical protein
MTYLDDLQRRLNERGASPPLGVDGRAGRKTAEAFERDLQSTYGVPFVVVPRSGELLIKGPSMVVLEPDPPPGIVIPGIRQGAAGYEVTEIVVHCAATGPGWLSSEGIEAKVREIRRWHMHDNGWRDIGYHHIIDRDGAHAPGRPETEIGAGVEGHNRGVIHICLIGGREAAATDDFRRHFTFEQDVALRNRLAQIRTRARIRGMSGHNEWAAKGCPGFHVPTWLGGPAHV